MAAHMSLFRGTSATTSDVALTPVADSVIPALGTQQQLSRALKIIGAGAQVATASVASAAFLDIPSSNELGRPAVAPVFAAGAAPLTMDMSMYPLQLQTGDPVAVIAAREAGIVYTVGGLLRRPAGVPGPRAHRLCPLHLRGTGSGFHRDALAERRDDPHHAPASRQVPNPWDPPLPDLRRGGAPGPGRPDPATWRLHARLWQYRGALSATSRELWRARHLRRGGAALARAVPAGRWHTSHGRGVLAAAARCERRQRRRLRLWQGRRLRLRRRLGRRPLIRRSKFSVVIVPVGAASDFVLVPASRDRVALLVSPTSGSNAIFLAPAPNMAALIGFQISAASGPLLLRAEDLGDVLQGAWYADAAAADQSVCVLDVSDPAYWRAQP